MSKSKPTRRKKSKSATPSRPLERSDRDGRKSRFPAMMTLLVVVAAVGLGFYLYRRTQLVPAPPDPFANPNQPAAKPVQGYAGPAAFSFTLENAALSPDGRATAWAYQGNDVVMCVGVWNGAEPDLSQQITLSGHDGPIRALAFSSLGQSLASASADRTVKIWDAASGQEMFTLAGHTDEVTAVAFSPDGVSMATGSRDKSIRLWDAFGGLPMVTLSGHTDTVRAIAYSNDGKLLASAADDGSIKLWDMEIGQEIRTLEIGDHPPIRKMSFSPSQLLLATSDGGNVVRLWDVTTGQERRGITLADGELLSVAFSYDGAAVAVAGTNGRIMVQNLVTGQTITDFVAPHTPLFTQFGMDQNLRWSRFQLPHLTQMGATGLIGKIATANRTAEKAIAGFGIPDGLQVKLFANESLVANPAAICSDDQGRIFVAETFRFDTEVSLGYAGREIWLIEDLRSQTPADRLAMYEKYQDETAGGMGAHQRFSERIRRLEDTDGDGRADQATVFAEGFDGALTGTGTGLITRGRDLYYTCIPDLWKLTDNDDDGIADARTAVHTGFGVKASLPHGLHGLAWGPDGKLYFSIGDRGYHIDSPDGTNLHNPATGAVLRCNPDGSELEEIARGLRNPQELAFDQFGNLFTCDNNSNLGDKARLVYVVPGGDSGWHMSYETMPAEYPLGPWNMDKMWQPADPSASSDRAAWVLPPIALVGTGPAGLAYYPGSGLPERYDGHFFLCDFADAPEASGVRSFAVKPAGAGFEIQDQHTFISNILPTDIEFGFDQKIYISDWIRGASSDGLGRIYVAGFPKQMSAEAIAKTKSIVERGFDALADAELIQLLGHADMRVRQRSQFALADRGSDVIELMSSVTKDTNDLLVRLHAIWALGMLGRKDDAALKPIANLLADQEPEVRAQAAKVLGEVRHQASADKLIELLTDQSRRVRSFAAHSLGRIQYKSAIDPIVTMLRENNDQDLFLRHAGVHALFNIGDVDAVAALAADKDRAVRMAALLALRQFRDDRVKEFLDDSDQRLVVEAARAIHDVPIESALGDLAKLLASGGQSEPLLRRAINANFRLGMPDQASELTKFVDSARAPDAMKIEAIRALGEWIAPAPRDRVLGFVTAEQPLPRSDDAVDSVIAPWVVRKMELNEGSFQKEIVQIAARLKVPVGNVQWITDPERDIEIRTKLIDMMADRQDKQSQQAIDAALDSDQPLLRIHAARILARLDSSRAFDALSKIIDDGTTAEQQFAFTTLGTIKSPKVDTLLVKWLGKLQAGQVPPPLKLEIMSTANERDNTMVRQELSSLIGFLSRQTTIAGRYQAVLEGGSVERGRMLFENHTQIQCLRCHIVAGKGGKVGPDLTGIGGKVTREYLLESLVAPGLKIAKGFEGVIISTVDGTVVTGILQGETDTEIQLVDATGKSLVVAKNEIEQRQGGKSVMPDNLLQLIRSSDIRDLVEYLASLK